jgi:hypothetical protein
MTKDNAASPLQGLVMRLGFARCNDGLFRRLDRQDFLCVELSDDVAIVYAETDDQGTRIPIATFRGDGSLFERWLVLTDGKAPA